MLTTDKKIFSGLDLDYFEKAIGPRIIDNWEFLQLPED
jgi:hypothetical protein